MFAIDEADFLIDFFRGGDFGGDGDRLGVVKDSVSQFFDRGAQGSREEEGLTLSGKFGDDALDVAKESHVEHAVDFIENEVIDAGKVDISLVHVIEKAPGAGDENVDAGLRMLSRVFLGAGERPHQSTVRSRPLKHSLGRYAECVDDHLDGMPEGDVHDL